MCIFLFRRLVRTAIVSLLALLWLTPSVMAQATDPPANPNATDDTRAVLAYLQAQGDNCGVISGQQIGNAEQAAAYYRDLIEVLHTETGAWVGLAALDYYSWSGSQDYAMFNQPLIAHWQAGGLVSISWHPGNLWTGGDSWDLRNADLTQLTNPNHPMHTQWVAQLDSIATGLSQLRDAGVVVLWRPLHEMNGDWFWWGAATHPGDPAPYKALWRQMFDYFTTVKGLNNLLWVYSTSDTEFKPAIDFFYPGAAYVDIVGQDVYDDNIDNVAYEDFLALNKPFAFTEFGPLTQRDGSFDNLTLLNAIRTRYPRTVYWLPWHDWTENGALQHISIISNQNAAALLADACVVNRDEIDWQTTPPEPETALPVRRTASAPTIDGTIDALWAAVPSASLANRILGAPVGANDASATFRMIYDNTQLYLLVEITDDDLQNDSGAEWWEDDAVELYLDGDASRGTSYDGVDDFQLVLRWNDQIAVAGSSSVAVPAAAQWATTTTATGWRMEAALPLAALGIAPQSGTTFGLDVHIIDDDGGGLRENKLAWHTQLDENWRNPSYAGLATLQAPTEVPRRSVFATLEAEEHDAMQGVEVYRNSIGFVDDGDWLRYDQVDFGTGITDFLARVAVPAEFAGSQVELRLDALTNPPIGVMTIAATGGWDTLATQRVAISPISGVHDLYLRFAGGGGVGNFDWFRFAPVSKAGPSRPIPAELFGMHMHRTAGNSVWPTVPFAGWRLHDADGLFWHQVEPAQDAWDFTNFDRAVTLAEARNVELLYVLGQTPAWAAARPDAPSAYNVPGSSSEPANLNDWRDYVRTVATRYQGRIHYYEIWNEPDLTEFYSGDIPTMVTLAREAYTIIKEVDPAAQVVSPSVVPNLDGFAWLDSYLTLGGGAYADLIGVHLYLDGAEPPEAMPPLIAAMHHLLANHGQQAKALWNTESNFGYAGDDSLITGDDALGYVARAYLVQWHAGVARYYWYAWENQHFVGLRLTEPDETTPTPAAGAYRRIQQWLIGATLQQCTITLHLTWICSLIDSTGNQAQVVWNPDHAESYQLPTWAVAVRTLTGETIPVNGGSPRLVSVMPIYIASATILAGDGNGDGVVDAGDISACVLEIFDGDGTNPANAANGSFAGTAGCDANGDNIIDAGDLSCTVLLIFNGLNNCGATTSGNGAPAQLSIGRINGRTVPVTVPILLSGNGHAIATAIFTLDLGAAFDPTDGNGDGLPDAVQRSAAAADLSITATWRDGYLDVALADTTVPLAALPDGPLLTIDLTDAAATVTFATVTPPSLGSITGHSVPVSIPVEATPAMPIYLPLITAGPF